MVRMNLWTAAVMGLFVSAWSGTLAAADKYEVETKLDVEYGSGGDEKLLLDLAQPKGLTEPVPAILFIHGGGWAGGNRKAYSKEIEAVAARGYVAATISYRLAPKHPFPAQVEDCKCAVRYLRAHADELKIDPERIGAIGHSAGAHLSMMLGTMDKDDGLEGSGGSPDQSSKVQAVVAYFGPTDLTDEYPPSSSPIVQKFIGGTISEKKEQYQKASPITYVDTGDAPTLIFHGTKDHLVPHDQAVQMADALSAAGVSGRIELMLGMGHGWGGPEGERTRRSSMEFFEQILKKNK